MNRRDRTARFRREPTVVATSEQRDRALAASAAAALVSRLLTALSSLVSIGLAARALDAPELGVVTVLSALLVYFAFGDFGMGSMVMTQLPRAHALGDVAEMRRIVSSALSAMLIIAGAAGVLGVVSVWVLPWQHLLGADDVAWSELRITLVAFFVMGAVGIIGTVGSRVLAALQRATLIRVCDSVAAVVSVALVGHVRIGRRPDLGLPDGDLRPLLHDLAAAARVRHAGPPRAPRGPVVPRRRHRAAVPA